MTQHPMHKHTHTGQHDALLTTPHNMTHSSRSPRYIHNTNQQSQRIAVATARSGNVKTQGVRRRCMASISSSAMRARCTVHGRVLPGMHALSQAVWGPCHRPHTRAIDMRFEQRFVAARNVVAEVLAASAMAEGWVVRRRLGRRRQRPLPAAARPPKRAGATACSASAIVAGRISRDRDGTLVQGGTT